jgi:hypothetical protein
MPSRSRIRAYSGFTMKQLITICALTALATSLFASDEIQTPWSGICAAARGRELAITTSDGVAVTGYCIAIDAKEITVRTADNRIVKVGRAVLSRLSFQQYKGHQLQTLRHGVHKGLKEGADNLLTVAALWGIVEIPVTLAWGAVTLPFCALGDLRSKLSGGQQIKVTDVVVHP